MENPLKTCDCKIQDGVSADPMMEIKTVSIACPHGIGENVTTQEMFGHPMQLVHLVTLAIGAWTMDDDDAQHVLGYIINDGEPDETHLWKFPGGAPSLGWERCRIFDGDHDIKRLFPHQAMTVVDWTLSIVGEMLDDGLIE